MDRRDLSGIGVMVAAVLMAIVLIIGLLVLSWQVQRARYLDCRAHGFSRVFCGQWQYK